MKFKKSLFINIFLILSLVLILWLSINFFITKYNIEKFNNKEALQNIKKKRQDFDKI